MLQQARRDVFGAVPLRETLNLLISAAKALEVERVNGNNELHPHVQQGPHNIGRQR